MVCNPSDNSVNIPQSPTGPSIPGLGLPFSSPKTPFQDVNVAGSGPEDIIELVNTFNALFPQGVKFKVNASSLTKTVQDAIANLFNQMSPYMAFYKMFTVLLDLVMCIINVICSLLNPFSLFGAVQKLFKQCIPAFLSLFPQTAVAVMVLSLVLLLIAIIEYIIVTLIDYVSQVVDNIKILEKAYQTSDTDGILSTTNKIAYLLCGLENVFACLVAIQALIAIIQPLLGLTTGSVCGSGDSCCGDDFCPAFIRNNPQFMTASTGRLLYYPEIKTDIPAGATFDFLRSVPLSSVRSESWQFIDLNQQATYKFVDVITPSVKIGMTYWPEGESYQINANTLFVPYLLDMTLTTNPASFGHVDVKGARVFHIKNCVVKTKPTNYVSSFDNGQLGPASGTLSIGGGLVYEDDDTPYLINGVQATLDTFIHSTASTSGVLPTVDDGVYFYDVSYTFKWNFNVMVDKKLTTVMCQPDLSAESAVMNAEADKLSVDAKLGPLPDVDGLINNLNACLSTFRSNINIESAATFQQCATGALNKTKTDSEAFYCQGIKAVADRYKSEFSLDYGVQFTSLPITVNVIIKDKTNTQLAQNITAELGACVAGALSSKVTLGTASDFVYDGYGAFTSKIRSTTAGIGDLSVFVNKEIFAEVINRDSTTVPSSIVERHLAYEFIDATTPDIHRTNLGGDGGGDSVTIRFDIGDA